MTTTRFAPAPTGHLHLGHVVNGIFVWGLARAAGGRVILRMEDHDRQRARTEFERAILDDLDWLGLAPDWPATDEFRRERCDGRQSDRGHVYEAALARLRSQGLVYACECSRSEISAAAGQSGEELRYPGTCAAKGLPERPGLGLRVRLSASVETFDDLVHGLQSQQPSAQCGDLLIRDRDGNWTYQFAVTVDDLDQQVTHVIRGDDLIASTGRQIQLARLLGRQAPPRYLHHALIMKNAAQKLSKSDGDTGIGELRRQGWKPEDVLGESALRAGLIPARQPLAFNDLPALPLIEQLAKALR